jgi:hypothetical protein
MNPDSRDRLYSDGLASLGAEPEAGTSVVVAGEVDSESVRCVATNVGLAVFEATVGKVEPVSGAAVLPVASAALRIVPWTDVSASVRSTFDRDQKRMVVAIDFEHPKVDLSAGRAEDVAALAKSLLCHFDTRGRKG